MRWAKTICEFVVFSGERLAKRLVSRTSHWPIKVQFVASGVFFLLCIEVFTMILEGRDFLLCYVLNETHCDAILLLYDFGDFRVILSTIAHFTLSLAFILCVGVCLWRLNFQLITEKLCLSGIVVSWFGLAFLVVSALEVCVALALGLRLY